MRENRPYGSEGGEAKSLPYPYRETSSLRAQFRPVEFFLELMKSVVADGLGLAQAEQGSPRGADRAPPQRICRKFAGRDAAIGIAFRAQQQRAVFEPEDLGFLGWIAVDFIQRRAVGDRAGARDLRCHRVLIPELQCRD